MSKPAHRLVPLAARADWENALVGVPHAFAHTWSHCHAMHLTSSHPTYLYCCELNGVRIVCPVAERTFRGSVDLVTPSGFSGFTGTGECSEFPQHWRDFASSRGYVCAHIGVNPLLFRETYAESSEIHQYNSVFWLDLTLPADELLARMSSGRRRELRGTDPSSPLIYRRETLADFLIEHHYAFLSSREASPASYMSARTIRTLFDDERVLPLGTGTAGELEAVSVFGYTGYVGDFLFNVSIGTGAQHSAALAWQGAMELKSRGVPVLNLGGGIRPNDGVAEFKRRFGATELPLRGIRQVFDAERFVALCRGSGADPDDRNGYFPPYRATSG